MWGSSLIRSTYILPEVKAVFFLYVGWLLFFSFDRLGLVVRNISLAQEVPIDTLAKSFLVGLRFDLAVTSFLLMPVLAWMLMPGIGWQMSQRSARLFPLVFTILWTPIILLSLSEWEFYWAFHQRFNNLAIRYITDDPDTVFSMIWNGFPVVRYLFGVLILCVLVYISLWQLMKPFASGQISWFSGFNWKVYLRRLSAYLIVIVLVIFGARGGFQPGAPIRWGDAFFSDNTFANQMALNGIFALVKAAQCHKRAQKIRVWKKDMDKELALKITRQMVVQFDDRLLLPDKYPLFRRPGSVPRQVEFHPRPKNLVVILMESMSGEFVHAMGAPWKATPVLDDLISKGILFDRFFSQGTHTHQALYSTMCSFPNLPGHEYLMQSELGLQGIPSLPMLLRLQGYHTLYIYNGVFNWDNQKGFFKNQGMEIFIGRDDFESPIFKDPTWGVCDEDVMRRAVKEIDKICHEKGFFALVQTLSNHEPYKLPPPAPFKELKGPEDIGPRLQGVRYADYALGVFFKLASTRSWFKDTLFIILGDHGFDYRAPESILGERTFHIPFVIYYPGDMRWAGKRFHAVGSQVDLLPTVLGLMGLKAPNQAWGRDLFRLNPDDEGFAIVKPSGDSRVLGYFFGKYLLVKALGMAPVLYSYQIGPMHLERVSKVDKENLKRRIQELRSYVQTGRWALETRRAGVPKDIILDFFQGD